MVNNKDKPKPWHKRLFAKVTALAAAVCMMLLPATAHADMQGIDVSNWQCGIDIANTQADFVVVGTTWGTGQVYNNCLVSGVNTDANRMIAQAQASGKKFGLYHYAMGGNPEAEAQFFYRNTSNYWRHGIVALDWEMDDNPAWGNWNWVRRFMNECERLSGGVRPLLYTGPVAGTIPQDIRNRYGLWIAQYANMNPTGYQASPWMLGAYGEAMRQYSGTGVVNTWSPIDLNIFRGEAWQWDLYSNPAGKTQTTTPPQAEKPPTQTVDLQALATAAIRGDYGNGQQRRDALGANYDRVMAIVNQRLNGTTTVVPQQTTQANTTRVTVRSGDTMSGIASRTGLWPLSAWSVPSGNLNVIYPGQVVTYNGGGSVATGSNAPPATRTVTVRSGDTLGGIAARLGIGYTQLTGYHSGNPNLIYPGEVLHY